MELLITTHGRHNKQITLASLGALVLREYRTSLVVQTREYLAHEHAYDDLCDYFGVGLIKLPAKVTNLAETRQFLIHHMDGNICLLDDDFTFAVRRTDDPTKFRQSTEEDMLDMVRLLTKTVSGAFPLAGIASRQGGNRLTDEYNDAARQGGVHAINTEVARRLNLKVDRLLVMNDFDMILQFLTNGECNRVLNNYVWNQGGSNTAGGVSAYRTREVQATCANALHSLYPDFVRVVTKHTKGSWGGGTRQDVVIQWKQAYAWGVSQRNRGVK